ncbi:hypothetical protein D3C75_1166290 [compost metagenome]
MIQRGVMQHRRMLIQRNNVVIRYIGVAMPRGGEVSLVDIKLTHAGQESLMSGTVPHNSGFLRFAHAGQLVARFD